MIETPGHTTRRNHDAGHMVGAMVGPGVTVLRAVVGATDGSEVTARDA
jgi:hypothetical protein